MADHDRGARRHNACNSLCGDERDMMVDLELDELKREFLAEAEEKVREMQTALGATDRKSLDRLAYLAHQLKGSGGSYGYQAISAESAEIEKAVENVVDGDGHLEGKIREHIGRLAGEIDRSLKELNR